MVYIFTQYLQVYFIVKNAKCVSTFCMLERILFSEIILVSPKCVPKNPIDYVISGPAPINCLNHIDNIIHWHFNPSMHK